VNLSVRIFLAYFVGVGLAVWFALRTFSAELVPGMRQSLEEVLVDTANLLAEVVRAEVEQGRISAGVFSRDMGRFAARQLDARISRYKKDDPSLIVYITDARGIVLYDSRGRDVGADYSQWNDVYLTLRGEYGARTTRSVPADPRTSVMYVAAPITSSGHIIGAVTVGKPSITVSPFVQVARENVERKAIWLLVGSAVVGLLIIRWLTLSIRRLTQYARDVEAGKRVRAPRLRERELAHLAHAMEGMRQELEGKDYVENYLHALTHELKSPLAAVRGAAELLEEEMPRQRRAGFISNIRNESERMQQIVERLLGLAELEKRQSLETVEKVSLKAIVEKLARDKAPLLAHNAIAIDCRLDDDLIVAGERFPIRQAVSNLLDNAIEFSPPGGCISIEGRCGGPLCTLVVRDQGPGIPDYALARVFERFYSLPRPATGRKGTGLGLSLVHEVAQLHGGRIEVSNHGGGVEAALSLPALL
jgi:two-component system sensor histidine kinase CreC